MMQIGTGARDITQVSPSKSTGNVFVHRLQHSGSQSVYTGDARAPAPPTYWKSPYAGERLRHKSGYFNASQTRPASSSYTKFTSTVSGGENSAPNSITNTMKGILKIRSQSKLEEEPDVPPKGKPEISPRSAFRKLSAISVGARRQNTSSSQGKPVDKKVQFAETFIPAVVHPYASNRFTATVLPASISNRYGGFTFVRSADRKNNGRGDFYNQLGTKGGNLQNLSSAATSGNSAQFSLLIKSFNMSDSPRSSLKRENSFIAKLAQQKAADKLNGSRAAPESANRSATSVSGKLADTSHDEPSVSESRPQPQQATDRPKETDEGKDSCADVKDVDRSSRSLAKQTPYTSDYKVYRSWKMNSGVRKSKQSDDSSTSSDSEHEHFTEIILNSRQKTRPKTTASLYTRYNDNRRGDDENTLQSNDDTNRYSRHNVFGPSGGQVVNFCDKGKTHQIIDWLEQVNTAQSTEDRLQQMHSTSIGTFK